MSKVYWNLLQIFDFPLDFEKFDVCKAFYWQQKKWISIFGVESPKWSKVRCDLNASPSKKLVWKLEILVSGFETSLWSFRNLYFMRWWSNNNNNCFCHVSGRQFRALLCVVKCLFIVKMLLCEANLALFYSIKQPVSQWASVVRLSFHHFVCH